MNYNTSAIKSLVGLVSAMSFLSNVNVASTEEIDLDAGPLQIDGVDLEVGDRVLVKDDAEVTVAKTANLITGDVSSDNALEYEAVTDGTAGNDVTIEYSDPGSASQALSVGVTGDAIDVALETDAEASASADIGSGTDGTVTATVDTAGVAGNSYTIEVVVAGTTDAALAGSLAGTDITVTLGTDGTGAADDTKNTATLIAAEVNGLSGVSAVASGTGNTAISAPEGPTSFTGGVDYSLVSTASEVITAIEADGSASALVNVADYSTSAGTGTVGVVAATNLTGGDDVDGSGETYRNGVYEVTAVTTESTLVRASDADEASDFSKGVFVGVEEGDTNVGKGFYVSADVTTLNSDDINFVEYK